MLQKEQLAVSTTIAETMLDMENKRTKIQKIGRGEWVKIFCRTKIYNGKPIKWTSFEKATLILS